MNPWSQTPPPHSPPSIMRTLSTLSNHGKTNMMNEASKGQVGSIRLCLPNRRVPPALRDWDMGRSSVGKRLVSLDPPIQDTSHQEGGLISGVDWTLNNPFKVAPMKRGSMTFQGWSSHWQARQGVAPWWATSDTKEMGCLIKTWWLSVCSQPRV